MVKIIPDSVGKLWNEWDVRIMVVISLCLQILLILFGSRRKYIAKPWLRIVTWTAYLSADWVAAVALGMISSFQQGENDPESSTHSNSSQILMVFWVPFLLLHLGGPDTITAYSLEDNALWLRHLLGLLVEVGTALYIFLQSWTTSQYQLSLLAIPIFVSGIIKYGERTWVLRSASSERFRELLLPPPNQSDYAEFATEVYSKEIRGEPAAFSMIPEAPFVPGVHPTIAEAKPIHEAYQLFKILKRLCADLILDHYDERWCHYMIGDHPFDYVFKLLEIELGFMYDVLYTKANVVYSLTGIIFRSISLVCCISTFFIFCLVIDKHRYSTIDVAITYLLSVGAIALELYAIAALVLTDWTQYWLSKYKHWLSQPKYWLIKRLHTLAPPIYRANSYFRLKLSYEKGWSGTMTQFNLIDFCVKEKPIKFGGIQKFIGTYDIWEKYCYSTLEDVPIKMKQFIFEQLKVARSESHVSQVLSWRGDQVLKKTNCVEKLNWSLVEVPFDQSILLWHIATDLCYYTDLEKYQEIPTPDSKQNFSKLVSNYLMHILVTRPFMLPKGIGKIRFRDTCAEATKFFEKRRSIISGSHGKGRARQVLLEVNTDVDPESVIGDRSKTVLFTGCRLAKQLQSLETEEEWGNEEKWEMIAKVWIEMLCYAASQCGWNEHAQHLRKGGDFGLSEQFQIRVGAPRISIETRG
ncbi:PREDICTED: unnamed product [Prunus dulcis]|uniref:PREDICTED: unnamed product n=1 Tax=Prunus dulcis TaxID=3755 RepID=A0A5E4FQZ1_PRUDU|nr:PREDICTED: unnamed product [Prunus dulcis]